MHYNQKVMNLSMMAGEILLENGAEIHRVAETMRRIMEAFKIQQPNIYVTSNSIFASIQENSDNPVFSLRHVKQSSMSLRRIAAVNEVSREIATQAGCNCPEHYIPQLRRCATMPTTPFWLVILGTGLGPASFSLLFGGGLNDCAAALFTGFALGLFLNFGNLLKRNKYISLILGGALVTLCSSLLARVGLADSVDLVISGSIMPMVPGVLLTTSIRDFFNSDYLSGTIHIADALLVAVCISVGVGSMLFLWSLLPGGIA